MNKPNLKHLCNCAKTFTTKHSPEILTVVGIFGMTSAGVLAVRETPKALRLLEEEKRKQGVDKLPPFDVVKTTWKCYIPAVATGVTSAACLIGANSISLRRQAALATAYALSETALTDYRNKVVETIGEKKEQEVRQAVARDKAKETPVNGSEVIITNHGNTLCLDVTSMRHFYSDMETLKKAANELNRRMRDEMFITLNEFYSEIGLPGTKIGDDIGWHIDRGYLDLVFDTELAPNGQPCLVVDYRIEPKYNY